MGEFRVVFVDPVVGWFPRLGNSGVGRYSVWHQPLPLLAAATTNVRCELFEQLGLFKAGEPPAFAGVTPFTIFDVHTPPGRIA